MIEVALYLIPVPLSDCPVENVLPMANMHILPEIKHFIVENVRSARRFLKRCDRSIDINELEFFELNTHTDRSCIDSYLKPLECGLPMGVISEAGCPAIADPGADIVAIAQRKGLKVKPLVGPSSILMGLMASGFNGQSFAFQGYLPIDEAARGRKFKEMERSIRNDDQTQIFIETPYRNNRLIAEMCKVLPASLKLCVASNISGDNENIKTKSMAEWAKCDCNYDKVPTIFLLYK